MEQVHQQVHHHSGWRVYWSKNWEKIAGFLFVLPSIIAIFIFVYGFIGWTGWVSVSNWTQGAQPNYSYGGFQAYDRLFGIQEKYRAGIDARRFAASMRNVIGFTFLFLISCIVIGFLLAALLDRAVMGEGIFRSIFLFPMAISFIVTGLAWRWLFTPGDPNVGTTGINRLLEVIGLGAIAPNWASDVVYHIPADSGLGAMLTNIGLGWFASPSFGVSLGVITLTIAAMWQLSGYTMAIYLAGIRGIPEELREAARVDGCSEWQVYSRIVLPMLRPITLSAAIVLGHISLKVFDLIFAMVGTDYLPVSVPGVQVYTTMFRSNKFAVGSAIATVLLVMVASVIIPYLATELRAEHEM